MARVVGWTKALLAAAFIAVGTYTADAQYVFCTGHGNLVAQLGEKFQEKQLGVGTIGQVAVMEIFVAETGTWTIVITDVTGRSCIVAAGDNWENSVVLSGDDV
ncbi:hypothetical protein RB623_00255 [Mesorhizobium sp. LHD-90]|uniref:hypothetical protein n=1 Tax=Mesorhizobium sp. LHD-90 TaxID=3071414 RepID=UPI0027DF9D2C|nr:hypothetical protein [Mesorhizobium sp. LHD-90]MDQ6432480.1 hypothetical protein [Mesorhizobium sp. LHD-90]